MSLRKIIARESIFYSLGIGFVQIINVFLAIYIRNKLGPEQMGVWVILQVILNYTKYVNLGMAGAAAREVPFHRGRGDHHLVDNIRNASFTFTCAAASTLSVILIVAAFVVRARFGELVFYSLLALAFLSLFMRISNYCNFLLRAEKRFGDVNRFNIYSSLVNAALTVVLIHFFLLYGYYLSMVLSNAFNLFYLLCFSGVKYRFRWDLKQVATLSKLGIALILVNLVTSFFESIDKIAISSFIGLKDVGFYSLVIMGGNFLSSFPKNLTMVVFPYLNEAYGASKNPSDIRKFVVYPSLFMGWYLPAVIAFLGIAAPYFVHFILPKYEGGVGALKIGLFSTLFLVLYNQMSNVIITLRKQAWIIPINCALALGALGVNFLWIKHGAGIEGVAVVTVVASALLFIAYAWIVLKVLYPDTRSVVEHIAKVLGGTAYFMAVLFVVNYFFRSLSVAHLAWQLALFFTALVPVIFFGERQFHLFATVKRVFFEKETPKPAVVAIEPEA